MRLVKTLHWLNKYLFILLFSTITMNVFGQKKIPVNWNIFRREVGDHWVTAVHHSPKIYLNSPLVFDTGLKTDIKQLSALTFGTTVLRSSPKRTFTYGFGVDYNYSLSDIEAFNALYRYDIQSIGSSLFLGLQKPNIVGNKHLFVNLGFSQRVIFSSKLDVYDNNLSSYSKNIGLNKAPTFGYLEMGLQQDEFLRLNERTRLKNISVSIDFPFFNRSNLFSTKRKNYNEKVIGFLNTKNPEFAFRLNYQQFIDIKRYNFDGNAKNGIIAKRRLFLPPLVSIEDPETPLFGRIFVEFMFSSVKDSINISNKIPNLLTIPNSIFNQVGIGYNIHWGNYRYELDRRNRPIYYDIFGSFSIYKGSITSASPNLYKYEFVGLKSEVGARLHLKYGIYVLGGGGFQFPELSKTYTKNLTAQKENIQLPYKNRYSYFGGIAFKNLITLKLTHIDTEIIRQKPVKYWDSVYYSISIGF